MGMMYLARILTVHDWLGYMTVEGCCGFVFVFVDFLLWWNALDVCMILLKVSYLSDPLSCI